ncbi:8164_t:CDS:2, partial [Cetraspora pellucida]
MTDITKFLDEILIHVFKYIKPLIYVILTCKTFLNISKDSYFRTIWIFSQYGKPHALFYAVKLGPRFINVDIARLISEKIGISRYFIQRLTLVFGLVDHTLLKYKGGVTISPDMIKKWGYNLPFDVYMYFFNKGHLLYGKDLLIKGNDIERFHFESGGYLNINEARIHFQSHIDYIKILISDYKFVPFPLQLSKLIFEGTTLVIFPPNQQIILSDSNEKNILIEKFNMFLNLGLELDNSTIISIFSTFENRLDMI